MQEEYKNNEQLHRITAMPLPQDFVIAKSSDNKWYRGRVSRIVTNEQFSIFFIDLGFIETVQLRDLYCPLKRFMYLPPQSFECYLNGVQYSQTNNTPEGRRLFASLTMDRDLVARVIQHEPFLRVDLFDTSTGEEYVDIAKEMIDSGLVRTGKKLFPNQNFSGSTFAA